MRRWWVGGAIVAAALVGLMCAATNLARAAEPPPPTSFVQAATMISSGGGNQDWSHARDLIMYDKPDQKGNSQLHTVRPDGLGDRCLSCTRARGGPAVDRHKVVPIWHPGGQWAVVQVESDTHLVDVLGLLRSTWHRELVINGVTADLWAVSHDGSAWQRLTKEAWPSSYGVMSARFSPDGRFLLYSRLVQPASFAHPLGKYRLITAPFTIDGAGRPTLGNERDITPSGHDFAEAHGFSPDGSEVLFASYAGNRDHNNLDIWKLHVATARATRLTVGTDWDEHATYCANQKSVVYFKGDRKTPLRGELAVIPAAGGIATPVTAFNRPASPGYIGEQTMVMRPTFNANGTRMAVTTQLARSFPAHRQLWVLSVSGVCGN